MNIELCTPGQGETVSLLTIAQKAMLAGDTTAKVDNDLDWANLKRKGTENSYPEPVKFSWRAVNTVFEQAHACEILISEDESFSRPRCIPADAAAVSKEVYNLHANREYFWKVVYVGADMRIESPVFRFYTSDEVPTFYKIDGVTNVRDIGGWKTADGQYVRRNKIFRGSEMDTHHALTEEGRIAMRSELNLRTDLDLRGEAEGKIFESPIGSDIRFEFIPCKAYAEFMEKERFGVCRALFSLFADETAYPIYLHCWGGADRAGTLVLLLNALLGVDDESLLIDYEMTLFSVWGERSRNSDLFKQLMSALNEYAPEGSTLHEKVVNYLKKAGVTQEQMDKIRALLLEKR